jgi:hypothetical protein
MSDNELPVIHSIVRVNPLGYEPDDVMLRSDIGEVELYDPSEENDSTETWIVDELAERNDHNNHQELLFSSQSDIHDSFNHWLNESVFIKADSLTCLVVGGRGGGKSHTLFGKDSVEERGIIPRYVQSLYEVDVTERKEKGTAYHFNSKLKNLLLTMYIVHGDVIIDLLDPPHQYPIDGNLGYFDTFGATPLPVKCCHSDCEEHTLQLLHLGILSASMLAMNSEFLFNSVDIYVNFKLFYPNKVQTVTFIEASSLLLLHSSAIESSDFPKACPEMRSAEAFKQSGLFGPVAVDTDKLVNKRSGYESSMMTYMLQDALVLSGYRASSTYLTSTLIIGCLRGSADCFSDNKVTLDLILSMSEKHKEMIAKYQAKKPNGDYRQRLTHQISLLKLSDELVTLRNVVEKELQQKIPVIQKGDKMHTPRTEKLMKYEKRKKQLKLDFYGKKIFFLTKALVQLSAKAMKKKEKRHDLRVIKLWLRSRGLFGLQIQAEPDLDDPDYRIQQLMAGLSLDEDDDTQETVDYPSRPWSTDGVPMSEAYFMPITQLNFPSAYLFLGIPSGHLAVCATPLRFYEEDEETGDLVAVEGPPPKQHFEGIKHCKVLPIDGILVNPQHCILFRLGTSVKIRPVLCEEENEMSFVEVNSVVIDEETILQDGDVVRIGSTLMFMLKIPAESDTESRKTLSRKSSSNFEVLSEYGNESEGGGEGIDRIIAVPMELATTGNIDTCLCACLQTFFLKVLSDCLSSNLMKAHASVDRELVDLTQEANKTDEMEILSYIPTTEELVECCSTMTVAHKAVLSEAVLAALYANHWAVQMKRDMSFTVHLRKKYTYDRRVSRQYRGVQDGVVVNGELYDIKINAECMFKGQRSSRGDSWWWSVTVFMQRVFQMRLMHHDFVWKFLRDVDLLDDRYRGPRNNPFLQPTEPELIGVANIHLDNVFYLYDTRQRVPIISFKGNGVGFLNFKLRCWIDKVEALPDYLKLDNNAKFSDFMGRTCILRFYFDSLTDINPNLSNNIQITHNFFCHSGQYKTTRLPARDPAKGDTVAYIDNACMLSQVITLDFIRYTTKRSIELEIWGCRTSNYLKTENNSEDDEQQQQQQAANQLLEFKVGELSAVRNLKLPVNTWKVLMFRFCPVCSLTYIILLYIILIPVF